MKKRFGMIQPVLLGLVVGAGVIAILGSGGGGGGAGSVGAKAMGGKSGGDGYGGYGGSITLTLAAGKGNIVTGKPLSVNHTVSPPSQAEIDAHVDFGAEKLTIDSDTTFAVMSSLNDVEPADGTPYIAAGMLVISDKDSEDGVLTGSETEVTGVEIAKGATLTIDTNNDGSAASFWLDGSLVNRGTVTGENIHLSTVLDVVNQSGASITATDAIEIYADAYFINFGTADVSGEAGAGGGDITFEGYSAIINTGTISADGGDSTDGAGGDAGSIHLYGGGTSDYAGGDVMNSGALSAKGGDGASASGNGGYVELYSGYEYVGSLINTGNIDVSGGDLTDAAGTAGSGGIIEFTSYDDSLFTKSTLTAKGGNGTSSTAGNNGGNGGTVTIAAQNTGGDMKVAVGGSINTSGGDSRNGDGGDAGDIDIENEAWTTDNALEVSFNTFDASGSDGIMGAPGGYINIVKTNGDKTGVADGEERGVINNSTLKATGGASTQNAVNGAIGGNVYLLIGTNGYQVTNRGAIDVSGGESSNAAGGSGGTIDLTSDYHIDTTGNLTANGGNSSTSEDTGVGGTGGRIQLYANADLVTGGSLRSKGGRGNLGGNGGLVYANGGTSNADAYIRFRASASTDGGVESGPGGCIYINDGLGSNDAEISGSLSANGAPALSLAGDIYEFTAYTQDAWSGQGTVCAPWLD